MRPTPNDVAAGLRAILRDEIAPSLPKSAQPQLKRVMGVLRDARWDETGFDVLRENAAFSGLARDCADRLEGVGGLRSELATLAGPLRAAAGHGVPASFAKANAINRRLRDALARCIDGVRDGHLVALYDLCAAIGSALLGLRTA